jgi:hypothetical protein
LNPRRTLGRAMGDVRMRNMSEDLGHRQ